MTQPTSYTQATDFSDDELSNVGGRSTVRTAALDAELAAVATTLGGVLTNLALNQRDDGEIRDGRVKLHTLSADVRALLAMTSATPRGAWVTATAYAVGDLVLQNTNTYLCAVAHTAGTFATDLAAVRWLLVALGSAVEAMSVPFTPTATIAATNVQAAIEESDTENRALSAAAVATLRADLADTSDTAKGDALIGVKLNATGAAARAQHAKNAERVSCSDFSSVAEFIAACKLNGWRGVFTAGTYTFAAPITFDWNYFDFTFEGEVTLRYTGGATAAAVIIDGGAAGSGIGGWRFGQGGGPKIEATSATAAVWVRAAHRGHIEFECTAAAVTALQANWMVLVTGRIVVSANNASFVTTPVNGAKLDERSTGEGVADCDIYWIIEGVSGAGIDASFAEANIWRGTSEGNGGRGYYEHTDSSRNKLIEFFCEANGGADFVLDGSGTELDRCTGSSTTTPSVISGSRNVLRGGLFKKLSIAATAEGTILDGAAVISPDGGGSLSDIGIGTVYRNACWYTTTGSRSMADVDRKPRIKRVGGMALAGATKATKCVISISAHQLDYGESLAFASVGGMTQLNGNTYTVEPIDTNTFYILSGEAYVDSSAFGAYTSGGTATLAAFNSTWAVGGGSYRNPGWFKEANGVVTLFGAIKGSSLTSVSAFTLPAGFRPGATVTFPVWELSGPSIGIVQIAAAGTVIPSAYTDGANKIIALDGISFVAEG